jgi:hypothetical protein
MENFNLRIQGIASGGVIQRLVNELSYHVEMPCSLFLFFMYSDFDIPLNTDFFYLCEQNAATIEHKFFCKIIMATQGWGKYYTQIPRGHKSVCHVVFDEKSLALITMKIPVVDTWTTLHPNFILSTHPCLP